MRKILSPGSKLPYFIYRPSYRKMKNATTFHHIVGIRRISEVVRYIIYIFTARACKSRWFNKQRVSRARYISHAAKKDERLPPLSFPGARGFFSKSNLLRKWGKIGALNTNDLSRGAASRDRGETAWYRTSLQIGNPRIISVIFLAPRSSVSATERPRARARALLARYL